MKVNRMMKKVFCAVIAVMMLTSVFAMFAAAADSESVVTLYSCSESKLTKGTRADITVRVKNLAIKKSDFAGGVSDINVSHVSDSFYYNTSKSPEVSLVPESDGYLVFQFTFASIMYEGTGNTLSFAVSYGDGYESEILSVAINECREENKNQESVPATEPSIPTPETEPSKADVATTATQAPMVQITRKKLDTIKANDEFSLTVVFKNVGGKTDIINGMASFEPSEGLVLVENSSSKTVPSIKAGSSASIAIKLRAAKTIENAAQSVAVSYKFNYGTSDGIVQGTESEKLNIPVQATEQSTSGSATNATPNVIISSYSYGGKTVAAGSKFKLNVSFKNTSTKLPVENIVMSVETGEGALITSSSNTFYFAKLGAGKELSESIEMLASTNSLASSASINISFKYEYIDGGTRNSTTASESLSIPVYVADRFSVTAPEQLIGMQNSELAISVPYVNKGKNSVNNVEAVIEYDDTAMMCDMPSLNLGNLESGKSGTIDFYLTPFNEGTGNVTVKITYEDEMQEIKTVEIPVSFTVDPEMVDPYIDEPIDPEIVEDGSSFSKWIIAVIVVAVITAVIVVIVVVKKKKKKAAEAVTDIDWGFAAGSEAPQEVKNNETD